MKRAKLLALCLCVGMALSACGNAADTNVENTTAIEEVTDEISEEVTEEVADEVVEEVKDDVTETENEEVDVDVEDISDDETNEDAVDEQETETVALADVYAAIKDNVELVSPMEPGADFIMNFFGINISEYEEYVFEMSEEAVSAETIIMIKTNGSDQTDSAKAALETYIEDKKMELDNYLPEEYDITADSQVVIKGDYVYLVISHNASAIIDVIESNL